VNVQAIDFDLIKGKIVHVMLDDKRTQDIKDKTPVIK
jgi:hypothetical protein